MLQIDTVWPDTSDELHIIIDDNNRIQVRSANNSGASRAVWVSGISSDSSYDHVIYNSSLGSNTRIKIFQRGNDLKFIPNICTDNSGFVYDGAQIGNQIWLTTGIRARQFNDGTSILRSSIVTFSDDVPVAKRFYYNEPISDNGPQQDESYGAMYNYYTVLFSHNHGGIAPAGWEIASKQDFDDLISFLNSNQAFSSTPESSTQVLKSIACRELWSAPTGSNPYRYAIGNKPELNNITGLKLSPWGAKTGGNTRIGYQSTCYVWVDPPTRDDRDPGSTNRGIHFNNAATDTYTLITSGSTGAMNGRLIYCVKTLSNNNLMGFGLNSGFENPENSGDSENPDNDNHGVDENTNDIIIEEYTEGEHGSENPERDEMR